MANPIVPPLKGEDEDQGSLGELGAHRSEHWRSASLLSVGTSGGDEVAYSSSTLGNLADAHGDSTTAFANQNGILSALSKSEIPVPPHNGHDTTNLRGLPPAFANASAMISTSSSLGPKAIIPDEKVGCCGSSSGFSHCFWVLLS